MTKEVNQEIHIEGLKTPTKKSDSLCSKTGSISNYMDYHFWRS